MESLSSLRYPWQRYWIPFGPTYVPDADGFSSLRSSDFNGTILAQTLNDFDNIPCLILLGEPGIGKSTEIERFQLNNDELLCRIKLNTRSNESDLLDAIEQRPEFESWLNTDKRLYLFLDGLDEAFLNIKTIHNAILDWLYFNRRKFKFPQELRTIEDHSLFLRITCRSAMWNPETTKNLENIFGVENVRVFKLAPLTQNNVREAARCHCINEQEFVDTIIRTGLVNFSSEPITLNFLIDSYKSGTLKGHTDKADIYHKGCIRLSEEINPDYKVHSELSALQRLKIAARIAALLVLTKKSFIWIGDSRTELTENDLSYDDLAGDSYKFENNDVTISLAQIKEAINTALFTLHDNNRLAFKHKTFSEFLAAWHLTSLNLPLNTLGQYITSPFDHLKVIPQVQELAIWLCTMNKGVFSLLIESDPFIVLRSKRVKTEEEKFAIVKTLLKMSSQFEIIDGYEFNQFYSQLRHEILHTQLRKTILNKSENLVARRISINIAGACCEQRLIDSLLKVLSSKDENINLKRNIIDALATIGNIDALRKIQPYALEIQDDDHDDELKGAALTALYPTLLSTSSVLTSLTKPKRRSLYGSYRGFLDSLSEIIPSSDLDITIRLLNAEDKFYNDHEQNAFEDLVERLIERIWDHQLTHETTALFAEIIFRQIENYVAFFVGNKSEVRRNVLEKVIAHIEDPLDIIKIFSHIGRGSRLIIQDDWSWLITQIKIKKNENIKYARILYVLLDINNSSQINEFLELVFRFDELKVHFNEQICDIEINSEKAAGLKKLYGPRKSVEQAKSSVSEFTLKEDGIENCIDLLDNFSDKKLDIYWKLIYQISLERTGTTYSVWDFSFDVVKLPLWVKLPHETQRRVVAVSKVYLEKYKPKTDWIFTETYDRQELAGYKALLLLNIENSEFIKTLSESFWEEWHPVIIYCSFNSLNELPEDRKIILKLCADANKGNAKYYETIYKFIITRIDKKKELFDLFKIRDVVNERVIQQLITILNYENCDDRNQEHILDFLFELNTIEVKRYSKTLFQKLISSTLSNSRKSLAIIASTRFMIHATVEEWTWFWQSLKGKDETAKVIFLNAAPRLGYGYTQHVKLLKAEQRAEILIWLYKCFPPNSDQVHDSAYSPSSRDYIQDYRSQILRSLIDEGSEASVNSLKKVSSRLPKEESFSWWLISARENMRKNTWTPPTPNELRTSIKYSQKRFVRSEKELLTVVLESLGRFQKKLKGSNPMSNFLWNNHVSTKKEKDKPRPKDENSLSDLVKVHLDYDLIQANLIINREVEIKRTTGKKDGEKTDIYVQAISDQDERLTLVIEVKGCWHPELHTSMEHQLKNRYLSKYKSSVGIYLIGWFYCSHYNAPQKHKNKKEFIKKFEEQAMLLSDGSVLIKSIVLDCAI